MKELFKGTPRLETERLLLRRITYKDEADIFAYASDSKVAKYMLWDTHRTIEDTRRFIRYTIDRYRNDDAGEWGIILKGTGHLIGAIGFPWHDYKNRRAEVGYVLSRQYWGNGIMPEALARILKFAFEEMGRWPFSDGGGINRVESCHFVENEKSGRVMQKCGMKYEGTAKQRVYAKGRFWDIKQYAILREEWEKIIFNSHQ